MIYDMDQFPNGVLVKMIPESALEAEVNRLRPLMWPTSGKETTLSEEEQSYYSILARELCMRNTEDTDPQMVSNLLWDLVGPSQPRGGNKTSQAPRDPSLAASKSSPDATDILEGAST